MLGPDCRNNTSSHGQNSRDAVIFSHEGLAEVVHGLLVAFEERQTATQLCLHQGIVLDLTVFP